MPFFTYTTVDSHNVIARRWEDFGDVDLLFQDVSRTNEELIQFTRYPDIVGTMVRFLSARIKPVELAEICRTISLYVGGGLDLASALRDSQRSARSPALKRTLTRMLQSIQDGYLLSAAMERTRSVPPFVVNLARIGEESGSLDKTMADAAAHIERTESIKSATRRALIYPLMTLTAMFGGFIFWMGFVVPKIVELFSTMNVELPLATVILIHMSAFVADYWAIILFAAGLTPTLFLALKRHAVTGLYIDRMIWNMPVMGGIVRGSQIAFYFQYLQLMYKTGVPISTALTSVADTLSNRYLRYRVSLLNEVIYSGETLGTGFEQTDVFDPVVPRMIGIGEQTGQLEEQLGRLARIFFDKVQDQVEIVGKLLEPVIMIVVALMFAFFALALLGPLYDLMGNMGG